MGAKGQPKTGGRKKGTPNKSTVLGKASIIAMLNHYAQSGKMAEDFDEIEAKDRLTIAERLMQYVLPKMQATAIDLNPVDNKGTIEDRLISLSQEQEQSKPPLQ